jgi:hypothetical protein
MNDLPESEPVLCAAIDLACSFDAKLTPVCVLGVVPAYTAFAIAADPISAEACRAVQMNLHESATPLAGKQDVDATKAVIKGRDTQAMLRFLRGEMEDLLVIGLKQHDFYLSRLWSTVYALAQDAPCSVLGVH